MGIFGQLDIGQQFDLLAVQRNGGRVPQAFQLDARLLVLLLALAVNVDHVLRRIDQHLARIAVDDDPVIVLHQLAGIARADYRRYAHAARHNGGVAVFAAGIGHKAFEYALAKVQHVGWRQIVRHQHQRHVRRGAQCGLPLCQR